MSTFSRIASLALLTVSGVVFAAAPRPNTHTVIINGTPQTFANLPGAPVGGDSGAAYQFRTRVSTAPHCARFANESDAVFLNGTLPEKDKVAALQGIESAAKSAQCLTP
jgi:hypothetical protein